METGEDKGGAQITRQVEGTRDFPTAWFVLVFCSLLSVSFSAVVVSERGVLYYVGESSPTILQESIIEEWMKLPVVSLLYDGPEGLKEIVENAFIDSGILIGVGTPVYVFARENDGLCAFWMRFDDFEFDNFEDPTPVSKLKEILKDVIKRILGNFEKPPFGFEVSFEDGKFIVNLKKTDLPVVFRKKISNHRVITSRGEKIMKEGFHLIDGRIVYVGKDMDLRGSQGAFRFIEGVEMVYPNGWVYSRGFLIKPDGSKEKLDMPVGIWKGYVVLRNLIVKDGRVLRSFKDTVLDVFDGFSLLSDGSVSGISEGWRMKISCTPLEWAFRCGRLYVLDICGNLVVFDPRSKRIEKERYPSAYGFDFLKSGLVIGTDKGVRVGGKIEKMRDFCVEDGELKGFDDVIRTHVGLCIIRDGDVYRIHGTDVEGYDFKVFEDFIVLRGEKGIWVVKSRRDLTSCW